MQLDARLGVVIHQRTDAARLIARQKLTDDAAGGEDDRIFGVNVLGRADVGREIEPSLAVGEVEWPGALGHRVPGPGLEEANRSLRARRRRASRRFARTRPEDAEIILYAFIRHAGVIGHAALRVGPKLLENRLRTVEREPLFAAERLGDVLDDLPVRSRLAWALDGLLDSDDSAFGLRHRAFVLFLQRARQDNVGEAGCLAHEEVDDGEEFQLFERSTDEVVIRKGNDGVEANAEHPFDLAFVDLTDDLVGVHAGAWQISRVHAPYAGDVGAMLGIGEIAAAGKLVALLAVLAPALAVGLAGDGGVAALGKADPPGGQHNIDRAHHVLHVDGVVFEATSVQQKVNRPGFTGGSNE